jgi:DNA/RNA endonuclease YhcR with UshA esterase domain
MIRFLIVALAIATATLVQAADEPIAPEKAREFANKKVTLQMEVKYTKNLLKEKQEVVYLDSLKDFKDKNNIAIVVHKMAAEEMEKAGIKDPATHFMGKTIKVTGLVKLRDDAVRIHVDKADQISIVAGSK